MKRDLLTVGDLTKEDIENILKRSSLLKEKQERGETHCSLIGKSLGMFFEKASTRTRVSFEVGMAQLYRQRIRSGHGFAKDLRGTAVRGPVRNQHHLEVVARLCVAERERHRAEIVGINVRDAPLIAVERGLAPQERGLVGFLSYGEG